MSLNKPDIMQNVGQMPTVQSIGTTTSILEPVVHTESMCRFVLENKGGLHSNSKIVLGVNATDKRAFFPPNLGVHCLISKCSLKFYLSEYVANYIWVECFCSIDAKQYC